MSGPDEYRLRLKGRADLLEAARLRYRALWQLLRSLRWKARLRKNARLLRETAAAQAAVDAALAAATQRAMAEQWPKREPMARCLVEVAALQAALTQVAAKRLRDFERSEGRAPGQPAPLSVAAARTPRGLKFLAAMEAAARRKPPPAVKRPAGRAAAPEQASLDDEPLGALLTRLDTEVVSAAHAVLPGQRWATALEALPSTLPEVRRAADFGKRLEPLFGRPRGPQDQLPFDVAQARALAARWAEGEAALAAAWERLAGFDRTGSLVRYLQRRARRAPLHAPSTGPEQLLHAEFWHGVAASRLREVAAERFGPVEAAEHELLDLVVYACEREGDERARLSASERLSDARAGLYKLAYELWRGLKEGGVSARPRAGRGPAWPAGTWERLFDRARRADAEARGGDFERLRDTLRLFIHIRSGAAAHRPNDGPLYRTLGLSTREVARPSGESVERLAALVEQARALAEVPPLRSRE